MKGIGFYNMKVFKEKQWFDFEKLTLLTGTNNSGKSSVIGAMQMLQESINAKDMQELLKSKIEIKTNQNKHGSLFNFVNNKSTGEDANKFFFYLQNGNIIYGVLVEVKEGVQSYGTVKAVVASEKRTKEVIFRLIPIDLENQFECKFIINYKYFLDKFYLKCENTLKLIERRSELVSLVELVKKDKADIAELRKLADDLSKEFSVYVKIDYCHYNDPNFELMFGVTLDGKSQSNKYKDSKTSIVNYSIEKSDLFGDSPNQDIEELGVFFNEGSIHRVAEKGISLGIKRKPSLFSKEEIDKIYTSIPQYEIFDFSFLWRDNEEYRRRFEQLICTYYGVEFKTAYRKLCKDLILVLSNTEWRIKNKRLNPNGPGYIPKDTLESYVKNLPYFGLFAEMLNNGEGNSYTPHHLFKVESLLKDNEREDIKKLFEEGFFEEVYKDLKSLIIEFIIQKNDGIQQINDSISREDKKSIFEQRYDIYKAKEPVINVDVFDKIEKHIMATIMNVDFTFKNHYVSSNRFVVQRSYSFNDNSDFSHLLEQVESLIGDERKECNSFINKWIKAFGIADKLILKADEDTGNFKAFLKKEEVETSLIDYGLGTNQLLPVIFALAIHKINPNYELSLVKDRCYNRTVVLEEPEANLHPALQSKLADMFVDAIQKFNVQIIAETHSEYLIRKLQYLSAKYDWNKEKEITINPKDISIYYFNSDEYVSKKEPKVKRLDIDNFGGLSDTFGEGFFDEATNLKFQLMKLNQSQSN